MMDLHIHFHVCKRKPSSPLTGSSLLAESGGKLFRLSLPGRSWNCDLVTDCLNTTQKVLYSEMFRSPVAYHVSIQSGQPQ